MTQGDRELIERLMDVLSSDHKRGCDGRTYTCNCGYDDQVEQIADQATDRLQALSAEVERLKEALATCDDAIREYFRYFYGGEMRGSYDGKPERAQLQKAGHAAAQALKGANNG